MPWGRVDDTWYDHPKLEDLEDERVWPDRLAGAGLNSLAWSWCNRFLTDGRIPRATVTKLGGTIELADLLVAVGLWEPVAGGYQIHDFLVYNDSAEQVRERRATEAARKAAWRQKHRPGGTPSGTPSVDERDVPAGVPPSVPVGQVNGAANVPPSVPPSVPGFHARASRSANPDPSRPVPTRPTDSPQPPASGGRKSRANGTNPRAKAEAAAAVGELERKARAWRRNQRQLAYYRGALTATELDDMNARDAAIGEIPDWTQHQAQLAAEADTVGVGG